MATTKDIVTDYSPRLDGMAQVVKRFLIDNHAPDVELRTHKGIADFCYKNSERFRADFLAKAGLRKLKSYKSIASKENIQKDFLAELIHRKGECVFLLKDTFNVMRAYQSQTGKGYGMLVNRKFLARDDSEEDYFMLIQLIYDSLSRTSNLDSFLDRYLELFNRLIAKDTHFAQKAQQIWQYVASHSSRSSVVFVDLGFQFTFSLFCYASVRHFSKGRLRADFYSFSAYPWLQDFFRGKYFSAHSEWVLTMELAAIDEYYHDLKQRSIGTLVGFAVGDSLGFPAAGIDRHDIPRFFSNGISSFIDNPQHPFFARLKPGQYTNNTRILLVTAKHLVSNRGFNIERYQQDLIAWGRKLQSDRASARWPGPTLLSAVNKLIEGSSYKDSGSTTTSSCSSIYRVIPLGIPYRSLYRESPDFLMKLAQQVGMITHNSAISKTGAVMTALIIADLVNGILPKQAIKASLAAVEENTHNKLLLGNIREAISLYRTKSVEFARTRFGTGSPIYQTLPLAIFIFLKYSHDFEAAVIATANSYRDDTPEEKQRLRKITWAEQLKEAQGGNTDGIAGLVGALAGAYNGYSNIPPKFRKVENKSTITNVGTALIEV